MSEDDTVDTVATADTFETNVRIRQLPRSANAILSALAHTRGVMKWELIRDALVDYAERHKDEIAQSVS